MLKVLITGTSTSLENLGRLLNNMTGMVDAQAELNDDEPVVFPLGLGSCIHDPDGPDSIELCVVDADARFTAFFDKLHDTGSEVNG